MNKSIEQSGLFTKVLRILDEWVLFSFSDRLKFGIKVSLSLMIAYMIPLAMGWEQAHTAAITVMVIATAGAVGESVMKGVIRVIGTVIGAAIGLTLIGMFPQEQMSYLLIVSILVTLILYLYQAYQGDSTVFMLMAMVMMLVFDGSGVDDVFLYGVDRTYMTIFGIVIYTLVGLFLWPVRQEDSTIADALALSALQEKLFSKILDTKDKSSYRALLTQMHASEQKLKNAYVAASDNTIDMALKHSAWESIGRQYQDLSSLLTILSEHKQESEGVAYADYIEEYEHFLSENQVLFRATAAAWQDEQIIKIPEHRALSFITEEVETLSHLQKSAVVTQAELIKKIHQKLRLLADRLNSIHGQESKLPETITQRTASRFVWLDPEYIKGALQTFLIYWFATAMWIYFNPPGGFFVVTLAVVMSVFTSFSPLKPSILTKLFTIGFIFATAMYIFVLPNLVYGWQLALFIFFYSFIAFYLINPKMSIFFLLGIYTLDINNTMSYNFDSFLTVLLMFYLFLAILMIFYYLPFSTKPEHLFLTMKRRLFIHAAVLLKEQEGNLKESWFQKNMQAYHVTHLLRTSQKLKLWASKVDTKHFDTTATEQLMAFSDTCSLYTTKLVLLTQYEQKLQKSPLYKKVKVMGERHALAQISAYMADNETQRELEMTLLEKSNILEKVERQIEVVKESLNPSDYTMDEITAFYINIALRYSVWIALKQCHDAMLKIDLTSLQKSRF